MNTEMQLFSISRKKKPKYEHGIAHKVYENKLNQDFHANEINQKWCTDFTDVSVSLHPKCCNQLAGVSLNGKLIQ